MRQIDREPGNGAVIMRAGNIDLARYVTERDAPAQESPRPYAHPLRTLGGTVVSGYRPDDHDWHWGLSIAIANIDVPGEDLPVNLWGGVTYTRDRGYVQLDNNGDQLHESWEATGAERLRWRTAAGRTFLAESRSLDARIIEVAGRTPAWRLDVRSEWTNLTDGPIRFGSPTTAGRHNAGYGGLFLRASPAFAAADVIAPDGPLSVDDAMGRRMPWLAFATDSATVALAAHAGNPVPDAPFFARTETPMLNAAPFFSTEWPLGKGETALWRWSLLISDDRLDREAVAEALAA